MVLQDCDTWKFGVQNLQNTLNVSIWCALDLDMWKSYEFVLVVYNMQHSLRTCNSQMILICFVFNLLLLTKDNIYFKMLWDDRMTMNLFYFWIVMIIIIFSEWTSSTANEQQFRIHISLSNSKMAFSTHHICIKYIIICTKF